MRVEPASTTTSILNNDGQEQGLSKLYRPVDPATLIVNDSGLNSQEQGLAKLYMPVDPATCVEPEESEIEEVKPDHELGDSGI